MVSCWDQNNRNFKMFQVNDDLKLEMGDAFIWVHYCDAECGRYSYLVLVCNVPCAWLWLLLLLYTLRIEHRGLGDLNGNRSHMLFVATMYRQSAFIVSSPFNSVAIQRFGELFIIELIKIVSRLNDWTERRWWMGLVHKRIAHAQQIKTYILAK